MATRSFYQNIINELDSDLLNNNTEIFISPISYQDNILSLVDNTIDNVINHLIKYVKLTKGTNKKIIKPGPREIIKFHRDYNIKELLHTTSSKIQYNNKMLFIQPMYILHDTYNLQPVNYSKLLHYHIEDEIYEFKNYLVIFSISIKPIIQKVKPNVVSKVKRNTIPKRSDIHTDTDTDTDIENIEEINYESECTKLKNKLDTDDIHFLKNCMYEYLIKYVDVYTKIIFIKIVSTSNVETLKHILDSEIIAIINRQAKFFPNRNSELYKLYIKVSMKINFILKNINKHKESIIFTSKPKLTDEELIDLFNDTPKHKTKKHKKNKKSKNIV